MVMLVVQSVISGRPPIRTTELPLPPVDCDVDISDDVDDGRAILLPNPKDCGSYYVCVGLDPVLMKCSDGLEFNPELEVCDWPQSANCTIQSN